MGSFADGMKMGQNAYQMSLDNERQAAKDAREKVIQGREDATYERAQGQIKDEDAAVQQYGLLTTQGKRNDAGIQANDVDFEKAVQATGQGLPMPAAAPQQPEWTPATDLDRNQGLQGISRARRDWNGVAALQKEEKGLKWDQTFGERLKGYTGADDQIGQAAQYLNTTSKRVSMGDPDKNGVIRMAVVKPDGRADFLKLTKQDQAQIYAAAGMMDMDPVKALTIMAGVNKELASAVAADNGIEFKLAEAADKSSGREETKRHNRAVEGNDAARTRAIVGRTPSEPDPKLVAESNRLYAAYETATPEERKVIERQWNMVQGQIATGMGKTMQLGGARGGAEKPQISNADLAGFYEKFGSAVSSFNDAKGNPMTVSQLTPAQVRAEAERFYGGQGASGGAPVVAAPPRARGIAPAVTQSGSHTPPPAPSRQDTTKAALIKDIDMRLGLRGISDETRIQLTEERQRLTGGRGMSLSNWVN